MNMKHVFLVLLSCLVMACGMALAGDNADQEEAKDVPKNERDLRPKFEALSMMPPDAPQTIDLKQRVMIELMERWIRSSQVRFKVSGTVVDETGDQLSGVRLACSMSQPTLPQAGGDVSRYVSGPEAMIDGDFVFEPDIKGTRIVLYFEKEGYYPEKRSFTADKLGPQANHDLLAGIIPQRGVTEIKDLEIVMQKIGELTTLKRRRARMSFHANGSGEVFDFDIRRGHLHGDLVRVANVTDPDQLPKHAAYLVAEVDEDGIIPATQEEYDDVLGGRWSHAQVPMNLRLVMTDSEGGFILFVHDEEIRGSDQAARQMVRAPAEGYAHVLELTPEIARRGHLFFFKVGDKYGRGKLHVPRVSSDEKTFQMAVEFQIQLDGSRNLETMTW